MNSTTNSTLIGNDSNDISETSWSIEYWQDSGGRSPFERWFTKLSDYDQAVVDAVIDKLVKVRGKDICGTEWGEPLGDGLYEIRIRCSLNSILRWGATPSTETNIPDGDKTILLRIFCTFYGSKVILLFQGYNKGKDPSERRQRQEIKTARKYLKQWKSERDKT